MEPILIFGHRHPDTDSICSSIALAELKKEISYLNLKILFFIKNSFPEI